MIQFNDLGKQWEEIREKALEEIDSLGKRGDYIGGKKVLEFEEKFSRYFNSKYSVGVSNGTDALKIAFQMFDLGPEDLVIIPANTFIADYLALRNLPGESGSSPHLFLVDHDDSYTISIQGLKKILEEKRSNYRKVVVVAVHLYGHPCDLLSLSKLKEEYELIILEDCSQSHGSECKDFPIGKLGEVSVYSLYPGKNLGALGDAGILTTDIEEYYERAKLLRNYGSRRKYFYEELGHNHRLDTIQSIILDLKLDRLKEWNDSKQKVANRYLGEIDNIGISLPKNSSWCSYHSYHIFCVRVLGDRENFMQHLSSFGVPTLIHYPLPIHKTEIFGRSSVPDFIYDLEMTDLLCDRIVSLPIHPFLREEEVSKIIEAVNSWKPA